jgi:4-amino-4-deoxy-L-arabinose transferase-like glycosyltransferase
VRLGKLFPVIALAAAGAAAAVGFARGTHAAGGSDSYCYLSQAELLASGRIVAEQPLPTEAPWERAADSFSPVGHVPAHAHHGATVPMCPPGYPLMMAAARTIGGRPAMFAVVPLFGALAVWWTFLLARRLAGDEAGAIAAILLAASPAFLYQIVQPMSDVPATALWAGALLALSAPRFTESLSGALAGGFVTGSAVIVRPNLVPVACIAALAVFAREGVRPRTVARTWVGFALGVLPFAIVVAVLQNSMYGGPLKSGYGDLDFLFRVDHVMPNLRRYPAWLLQTETPVVLLALAAPFVARVEARRLCIWLLAVAAAVLACYVPYEIFDAWWYLRFLLPAYPPILTLTAIVVSAVFARVAARWRIAEVAAVAAVALFMVRVAVDRGTFGLRDFERRFRQAGEYVAAHLPANAALITGQESGSVRFYSGRLTLFWRELPAGALDRALEFLRAQGYRPYLLIETWEQPDFVEKFGKQSRIGELSWPARVDINHQVRIYDPDDYARYRAGERIQTDRVWTLRR